MQNSSLYNLLNFNWVTFCNKEIKSKNVFPSMALKPINIRWISNGSQLYSIKLQTNLYLNIGGGGVGGFLIRLLILSNSIGNIKANSLQKNKKQFTSRRKRSPPLTPGSCLGDTYTLIGSLLN